MRFTKKVRFAPGAAIPLRVAERRKHVQWIVISRGWEEHVLATDDHPLNRLSSFELLTLSICLSVKSLPMLNPFVMRLLRSAASLSSA
jgi:hypothetical protein